MTDRDLAVAVTRLAECEAAGRAVVDADADGDERAAALATVRLIVPLKLAIERWILLRATRAALQE